MFATDEDALLAALEIQGLLAQNNAKAKKEKRESFSLDI